MGNIHSKSVRRSFSKTVKHLSIRKKTMLRLDRKSSAKASISTNDTTRSDPYPFISPIPIINDTETSSNVSSKTFMINGRKYQDTKKYMLPIDDKEQDKLVQEHFLYKFIFGNNFSAPVQDLLSGHTEQSKRNSVESGYYTIESVSPPRILDIACGNGTWVLEMATEFPNSEFYGIDFSPGYPTIVKPPNTFFTNHDILSLNGFPYPDHYFDYVFMRQVYNCFSESDWTFVVKEIKRVVKPGGYVEFRDVDPILCKSGSKSNALFNKYPELMKEKHEVNVLWARYMYEYLRNVGEMTDMRMQVHQLHFGSSGPIGKMIDSSLRSGFESHRRFFQCFYSKEDYDQVIEDIVKESIAHRSFFNYYVCWGRKSLLDYDTGSQSRGLSVSTCSIPARDNKNHYMPSKISHKPGDNSGGFTFFDADNVSDIDQFIEGFED